jgi:hypothetical protein
VSEGRSGEGDGRVCEAGLLKLPCSPTDRLLAPLAVQAPGPCRCPAGAEVLIRPEEAPARFRAEHRGQHDRGRDHGDEEEGDEVHACDERYLRNRALSVSPVTVSLTTGQQRVRARERRSGRLRCLGPASDYPVEEAPPAPPQTTGGRSDEGPPLAVALGDRSGRACPSDGDHLGSQSPFRGDIVRTRLINPTIRMTVA